MFSSSVQFSRKTLYMYYLFTAFMSMTFFDGSFNSISAKICAIFSSLSVTTLSIRRTSFLVLAQQDKNDKVHHLQHHLLG